MQGLYYFEENKRTSQFSEAELAGKLAEAFPRYKPFAGKDRFPVVYVRADNATEYGKVYGIIKQLSESGFYRVSLMSEAPQ